MLAVRAFRDTLAFFAVGVAALQITIVSAVAAAGFSVFV